jgi:hypothetical protein
MNMNYYVRDWMTDLDFLRRVNILKRMAVVAAHKAMVAANDIQT